MEWLLLIPAALAAIYVVGAAVVAVRYWNHPRPDVVWMVVIGWPYWVWLLILEKLTGR